jgi:hypothetical protein
VTQSDVISKKACRHCGDAFLPTARQLRKSDFECLPCRRKTFRRWNKSRSPVDWKKYASKTKKELRARRLRDYGLTEEDYLAMLEAQGRKCAICGDEHSDGETSMPVDHCHDSGRVRGLLCRNCNVGLGMFKDSIDRLTAAANYLSKAQFSQEEY